MSLLLVSPCFVVMVVSLLSAALGNHPLLPSDDAEGLPLPTVAVRRCSSTKLLEFANQDKRVREDLLIEILDAHFVPPAGQAPDLLFMPTSCGWADPALHQARAFGHRRTMLAAGAAHCTGSTSARALGLVNDTWCASHCSTSAGQGSCPEDLCTCVATQFVEVTEDPSPAPRLGYFALVASPWGAFPQARPLMQPLMEQQWPKKMVVLSTEIPAFATQWDGKSDEPEMSQMVKWGEDHPPAAGLAVPYLSADPPADVPNLADRPFLAAFVGSVYVNVTKPPRERLTVGRSPLRELLVMECQDPRNAGECGLATDVDKKETISRQEVYDTNLGMRRVSVLAEEMYQKARFTLCPWGDTLARKSTFDALMQGSIPVFFEGAMAKQYAQLGLIRNVSVQVPLRVVARGGVLKFLRALPAERVRRLHYDVLRMRRQWHMPDTVDSYVPGDAVDRIVRKVATHLSRFTAKSYADASNAQSVHGSSPFGTLPEIPLAPRLEEIKGLLASGAISQQESEVRRQRFFDARDQAAAEAEAADAAYALTHKRQAEHKAEVAAASTRSAERAAAAEVERVAAAKAQMRVEPSAAQGAEGTEPEKAKGEEEERAERAEEAARAEEAERMATAEAEKAAAATEEREEAERAEEERAAIAEADKVAAGLSDERAARRAEAERAAEAAAEKASAAAAGKTAAEKEEEESKAAAEAEKAAAAEMEGLDIGAATAAQTPTKRGLPPVFSYENGDLGKLEGAL